jgi:tetratricopeptide (TPR) repeat protein
MSPPVRYLLAAAACGVIAHGGVQPLNGQVDSAFARGREAFFANRLADALPLLRAAATSAPDQPERLLWYAETARRLGHFEEADSAVRSALTKLPCSSFAHTVLAGVYNPQYSRWARANSDTTWLHLRAAVDCDPDDGNAWIPLWIEALHHNDEALAVEALARLTRTHFLAEPFMVNARWLMALLPREAIVLTAGDLDTYPAVAVQDLEHLRPDVVVVNEPLLNLAWYTARLHSRYGIPLPIAEDQLAAYGDTVGESAPDLSGLVIGFWRRMAAKGTLERPLTLALSAGPQQQSAELGTLTVRGPFQLVVPSDAAP